MGVDHIVVPVAALDEILLKSFDTLGVLIFGEALLGVIKPHARLVRVCDDGFFQQPDISALIALILFLATPMCDNNV